MVGSQCADITTKVKVIQKAAITDAANKYLNVRGMLYRLIC